MKIPGLRWLIVLLAVAFVVIVAGLIFHARFPHPPAPVVSARVPPVPASAPPRPVPVSNLDRHYAETHLAGWLDAPRRDPFLQTNPPAPHTSIQQINLFNQLKLKAIWRQNGVSLAAINHGVYRLGDLVEGCKIVNIDDAGVGLENNGQTVMLRFGSQAPVTPPETRPPAPH